MDQRVPLDLRKSGPQRREAGRKIAQALEKGRQIGECVTTTAVVIVSSSYLIFVPEFYIIINGKRNCSKGISAEKSLQLTSLAGKSADHFLD